MSLAAKIGATVLPGSAHKTAPEAESERTQLHLLGFWPTVFNSRLRFGLGALFLLLVGLIIYRPLLPGNFIMDDLKLVQWDNPIVNGKLGPGSIWFRADFPLSTLALWLQWKAWASNPLGYHIVNIVLHALSAFLVWQVLIRLQVRGAWVAAVFFVVHPVCVSTVARIAEIKNTLSLPFFLLSSLCAQAGGRQKGRRRLLLHSKSARFCAVAAGQALSGDVAGGVALLRGVAAPPHPTKRPDSYLSALLCRLVLWPHVELVSKVPGTRRPAAGQPKLLDKT